MESSPQPVPSGPTPVLNLSGGDILIVPADDPELSKYYYFVIAVYPWCRRTWAQEAKRLGDRRDTESGRGKGGKTEC